MKSEPVTYGIHHLKAEGETLWDGVRNYQARNFLQTMAVGDQAFFYHSNCKPPGIVGLMTITAEQVVDPTQFDPASPYFDPKATPEKPRWFTVKASFTREFAQMITLPILKAQFSPEELGVLKKGNRLSVLSVSEAIAKRLIEMGQTKSS